MISWLLFLLKSTLILSVLYLFFRLLIRKETLFNQSRIALVFIVLVSAILPFIYLPHPIQSIIPIKIDPVFQNTTIIEEPVLTNDNAVAIYSSVPVSDTRKSILIATEKVVLFVYLAGVFISLLRLVYGISLIILLFRKSRRTEMNGVPIMIINNDIPAFSFSKYILISRHDYDTNSEAILTHELSHIKQRHFYDLMLMELVKIIYWFNPLVYSINRDLKEIHEFQADEQTLNSGIDAIKYQLLIIQKSVGHKKFALANSFNDCQIKNRITMMNKSKNCKVWSCKVIAFLPLIIFLLMAFGRKDESLLGKRNMSISEITQKIEIKGDGNYINKKLSSLEEIALQAQKWRNASNDWISLLIDESIPLKRIDEVRGVLGGSNWVVQSTVNSNENVYFMGDVSKLAKFKQGKYSDWLKSQLSNYPEAKPNSKSWKLSYSFIIDKNGKARDGHVVKGSKYPEINAAFEKVLSQIPDWEPASRRGSGNVSVYYKVIISQPGMKYTVR